MKTLKIWNGRDHKARGSFYVAAYSRADAARLLCQAEGKLEGYNCDSECSYLRELRDYFSEGGWGEPMKGITPERGVWHAPNYREKPTRIV